MRIFVPEITWCVLKQKGGQYALFSVNPHLSALSRLKITARRSSTGKEQAYCKQNIHNKKAEKSKSRPIGSPPHPPVLSKGARISVAVALSPIDALTLNLAAVGGFASPCGGTGAGGCRGRESLASQRGARLFPCSTRGSGRCIRGLRHCGGVAVPALEAASLRGDLQGSHGHTLFLSFSDPLLSLPSPLKTCAASYRGAWKRAHEETTTATTKVKCESS